MPSCIFMWPFLPSAFLIAGKFKDDQISYVSLGFQMEESKSDFRRLVFGRSRAIGELGMR